MYLRSINIDQSGVATVLTRNETFQCDAAGQWITSPPPAAIKTEVRNALKGVVKASAAPRRKAPKK